jgi:hypothetical protein
MWGCFFAAVDLRFCRQPMDPSPSVPYLLPEWLCVVGWILAGHVHMLLGSWLHNNVHHHMHCA